MSWGIFDPAFVVGLLEGLVLGASVAGLLFHLGAKSKARQIEAEALRTRERAQAARQADAWRRAGAANDESPHQRSARAELRGGPR